MGVGVLDDGIEVAQAVAALANRDLQQALDKARDGFVGKRAKAVAAVPTRFADEISLSGPRDRIRERVKDWENSPVTSLLVSGEVDMLRALAELVL